ncbi:MAG TPA: hypothetical protein ENJ30_12600 [Desulfobulbaceae bacterium]|nr:hypothetical protein [Desulfobulbaceae bacterium]
MRNVMTNNEVFHAWANQTQASARNSSGSVFFEGGKPYSYGFHYPVAKLVGEDTALFNNTPTSVTTARQRSQEAQAASHKKIFWVANPLASTAGEHEMNLRDYLERVNDLVGSIPRARKENKGFRIVAVNQLLQEAKEYADLFNMTGRYREMFLGLEKQLSSGSVESLVAEAKKAARERRRKVREKFLSETLPKFRRGEIRYITDPVNPNVAYLRVTDLRVEGEKGNRVTGNGVATSKGIYLELSEAKKLWKLISLTKARGKPFVPKKTIWINHTFTLGKITAKGDLHAGCHLVPYAESERVAKILGLPKVEVVK